MIKNNKKWNTATKSHKTNIKEKRNYMIKNYKKIVSFLLAVAIFMTSTGLGGIEAKAAEQGKLLVWDASAKDTGVISELHASYPHGKVLYCIINNRAAYCMNYGKSASGGQEMTGSENMLSNLSLEQQRQLSLVMYYGYKTENSNAPSNEQKNQYIATQALVWIVEANLLETPYADSVAQKLCASAPDSNASFAYYSSVKAQVIQSMNQLKPSFTSDNTITAQTIILEWNNSKNRYEKTITDTNNVLGDFNINISGVSHSISGNKITFYTNDVMNSTKTGKFTSKNGSVEITGSCIYWNVADPKFQEFVSTVPTGDPVQSYVKVTTRAQGKAQLMKVDQSTGVPLKGAVYGVYSDKACATLIEKITTNSDGIALTSMLPAGTYYMKGATRFLISV